MKWISKTMTQVGIINANLKACLKVAVYALITSVSMCQAADFEEAFDGPGTSWNAGVDQRYCRVIDHRRYTQIRRFGSSSERIVVTADRITPMRLMHHVSPALALDELTASVWVRSNRSGGKLMLRVIFPHVTDPESNRAVERWLDGDTYEGDSKWQLLKCQTVDKELRRRAQLLRALLGSDIDLSDPYVDRVQFECELGEGTTEFYFDELKLGPVVRPKQVVASINEEPQYSQQVPRITLQNNRLTWNSRPMFPTFLPYHGEPPAQLREAGIRLVWIPRHDDSKLIQALTSEGLGIVATPPLALSPAGEVLDAENAGLAPMGEETDPILMWMLGTAVASEERSRLANWQKQLLSADRRLNRPLVADVVADERAFSRLVPVLGISRTVQSTSLDFRRYAGWLADRHLVARPGSILWTWIETDPPKLPSAIDAASLRVLEPEQLRLQVYAALSSGVRGLGFWSQHGLFHEQPGAAESRLMLKQLHFELELLEPWLATATPVGKARIELRSRSPVFSRLQGASHPEESDSNSFAGLIKSAGPGAGTSTGSTRLDLLNSRNRDKNPGIHSPNDGQQSRIEATMLQSDYGTLLLATWLDQHAQFVPGQMAAHDVEILVPGIKETAKAWLITTTEIKPLRTDRNTVPGGTLIRLPQLELTTAIIISSDLSLGENLRRQMKGMQAESATCMVQLARAKLKRVADVIDELQLLGRLQPDSDRMLTKATQLSNKANLCLEQQDYALAREMSDSALQMLRILQRAHWDDALSMLSQPVSSPYTTCFQTLPEFWRRLAEVQAHPLQTTQNLLPGGDFEHPEDLQPNRVDCWQHRQSDLPDMIATAEVCPVPSRKGNCLRIAAAMTGNRDVPLVIPAAPITIESPSIILPPDSWVRIEGYVRVGRAFQGTRDGFQIRDSIGGEALALHYTEPGTWQHFEIQRPVNTKSPLRLTFTLHGVGEVWLDDLAVYALMPGDAP